MFLSAPITKTLEDTAHLRDWWKSEIQVLCTERKKQRTISEHLYNNLSAKETRKGHKVWFDMSHPHHNEEFTFLLQSCMCPGMTVFCYELKSWKQFWLKPQTNKWPMFLNPRLWSSLLHRALCNTSLGSSTTDYCSVCALFLNNLKASVQCEHWQWTLQKSGCGTIASS